MKRGSLISWFATDRGRQLTFRIVSVAAIGTSASYYLCHTFLLNKYKDVVQMYGLGVGIPVPAKVKRRIEVVMDDMQISEYKRKLITPFTIFGFDMFHAGCTHTRTGAIIGIPSNFNYETTADVDKDHILVNLDQISWNSDAGKNLLQAMVLSEEAQKFAIGREIAYAETLYMYIHSIFPVSMITFVYGISSYYNASLSLFSRPTIFRFMLYALVGIFGFGSWAFMQDFTTVHYETSTDDAMCSLGEQYIKGGLEFYSKLLQRNIALRKLLGNKGAKLYTVEGNDQYIIRSRHLPLTIRKQYMQMKLEELHKSKQDSENVAQGTNAEMASSA